MWVSSPVTGPTRLTHPSSPSPCNLHSPVLAAYCRLPRFLKGERGLFLAPVAAPGGRLEDMLWVPGCVVQAVKGKGELSPSCRGLSVRELTRRKERRGRRCSTDAGCLRRYDCSQRKCVYLSVCVCLCATCVLHPDWLVQRASLCSETNPAPSERLSCGSCSADGGWGAGHTHTHGSLQFCCCHDNHKSWAIQRQVVYYWKMYRKSKTLQWNVTTCLWVIDSWSLALPV